MRVHESLILINKIIFYFIVIIYLKIRNIQIYYKYNTSLHTLISSTVVLITLCTHILHWRFKSRFRWVSRYHIWRVFRCMMWETKDYGYVHRISVKWYSNSLIKMKWTKEKKIMKRARWWSMTMLMIWWVSNNKNGKYLTSALAICWEEHSLPFHYQPTTPCRECRTV